MTLKQKPYLVKIIRKAMMHYVKSLMFDILDYLNKKVVFIQYQNKSQ